MGATKDDDKPRGSATVAATELLPTSRQRPTHVGTLDRPTTMTSREAPPSQSPHNSFILPTSNPCWHVEAANSENNPRGSALAATTELPTPAKHPTYVGTLVWPTTVTIRETPPTPPPPSSFIMPPTKTIKACWIRIRR